MKYLFILLLLIAGCSKHDITPDLSGRWMFSTSSCSGDFSIVHSGTGYAVAPGGSFVISGVSYATGPTLEAPSNGPGNYRVTLRTPVSQSNATYLQFNVTVSTTFSSVTGGNPVTYSIATPTGHNNGDFNIPSFPLTRK